MLPLDHSVATGVWKEQAKHRPVLPVRQQLGGSEKLLRCGLCYHRDAWASQQGRLGISQILAQITRGNIAKQFVVATVGRLSVHKSR
jgi:hypothetical protein